MKNVLIRCVLLLLLVSGCGKNKTNEKDKVIEFVKQWNNAHTLLEAPNLNRYYSNVVEYYGFEFKRNEVQRHKTLLFKKLPGYTQSIDDNDIIINRVEGKYLVEFIKNVKYANTVKDYKSFLTIIKRNRDFKILLEGIDKKYDLNSPIFPNNREIVTFIKNKRQLFGDFNGDGFSDFANVISPEILSNSNTDVTNEVKCKAECNSIIIFSNQNLKDITVKGAYKSQLENLKDINSDGADEIGFWDIKPDSKTLYVYSAINGELLCKPARINTRVHKDLDFIDVFKKTGPNRINLSYSENVDGKWILKSQEYFIDPVFSSGR